MVWVGRIQDAIGVDEEGVWGSEEIRKMILYLAIASRLIGPSVF